MTSENATTTQSTAETPINSFSESYSLSENTDSTPAEPSNSTESVKPKDDKTKETSKPKVESSQSTSNSTPPQNTESQQPNLPTQSTAPTETSNPATSNSVKPKYTEADYQNIIDTIRTYGETKGLRWNKDFTFEQGHQYYGRPNIVDLSKESVINDLKYHVDKIINYYGVCDFKVIRHEYQGKLEFVVIYD